MLGNEFAGVLNSDDFSVYNGVIVGAQQKCLAHLRRHFKKVLQITHGNNTVVAEAFWELIDEAFRQHRIQGASTLKNSIIILGRGTLRPDWQNC
jgi:transposase